MMRLSFLVSFIVASALAQVSAPSIGFVRDRAGSLRPVLGVGGSFVLGEVIEQGVSSASFGKTVGFAKTESHLLVIRSGETTERLVAPPGTAAFYMGKDGEVENIYFPSARELWRIERSGFAKTVDTDAPPTQFEFRDGDLTLQDGTRIRLGDLCADIEWLSDNWLVVRGTKALYAVRRGDSALMQLPQADQ